MKKIDILIVFILLLLVSVASAQFRSQVSKQKPKSPVESQEQQSSILFEDLERFSIDHGFSLNMASLGGRSLSYGIYSNRLQYLISDKWSLYTNLDLVQPTRSSIPTDINTFNGQLFYGANLQYRPTKSFQLSISVDNYPRLYRYWPANRYSPFLRYYE